MTNKQEQVARIIDPEAMRSLADEEAAVRESILGVVAAGVVPVRNVDDAIKRLAADNFLGRNSRRADALTKAAEICALFAPVVDGSEDAVIAALVERLRERACMYAIRKHDASLGYSQAGPQAPAVDAGLYQDAAAIISRLSAELVKARAPKRAECSCMEVYGEDPKCFKHGRGTPWAKANPDVCDLVGRALAAEAALGVAREALRPFAEAADQFDESDEDNSDLWESPVAMTIIVGDFRRAAEALTGTGGKDG